MPFANINPIAQSDGILYANAVPLTPSEADLFGGVGAQNPDPIPTEFGAAIIAVVTLKNTGHIVANNTYVVMQTDLGDGTWVDMNWCTFNQSDGNGVFVMSNGVAGADTFQQSRQAGSVPSPQSNGSNQLPLGGRVRFVGQTTTAGGSSAAAGGFAGITATIRYKLLPLR